MHYTVGYTFAGIQLCIRWTHLSGPGSSIIHLRHCISLGQSSLCVMPAQGVLIRVTPHRHALSDTIMSPFHMLYHGLTLPQPCSKIQSFALNRVSKASSFMHY